MCLKSHWLSEKKIDGRMFSGQLHFFPDRRTLKFLKMKCNPTNNKTVVLNNKKNIRT